MPMTRCPGCSRELEVESQWLGERVRCDVCDTEFTARAEAPVAKRPRLDDFDDERPRRRRPAYDNYDDEPPRRRRPKKKSSAGKILLILGGAVLVILLGCAGVVGFIIKAATEEVEFTAADWRPTVLPNGEATALFPGQPNHTQESTLPPVDVYSLEHDDYDIQCIVAVASNDTISAPSLDEFTSIWTDEFQKETAATNLKIQSSTYQGYQARDFTCEVTFDDAVGRIILVPGGRKKTFYVIMAAGMNFGAADRQKFLNSLTIKKR